MEDATIAIDVTQSPKIPGNAFDIALSTDVPAFFVMLTAPDIPGRFDDNSFLLLPDSLRHITFTADAPCTLERLKDALILENL